MPKNQATKNVLKFIKEESQQAEAVAFMAIWQSIEFNEPVTIPTFNTNLDANLHGRLSNVCEKHEKTGNFNYSEDQYSGTLNNKKWIVLISNKNIKNL